MFEIRRSQSSDKRILAFCDLHVGESGPIGFKRWQMQAHRLQTRTNTFIFALDANSSKHGHTAHVLGARAV